jgi:hypothetical protein
MDLHTGAVRPFSNRTDHGDELVAGIVAAASPLVALPPVRAGFLQYAESQAPLRALFGALRREGAPEVDAIVSVSTGTPRGAGAVRDIAEAAERAIELGAAARREALDSLDPAARAEAERRLHGLRVPVIEVRPEAPPASRGLDPDPAANRAAFAAGAAAAAGAL